MATEGGTGLRRFRYFVAIVDSGSFTRAASMLHVAQPALSQQMRMLEAELGVTLLDRTSQGVAPTAAGKLLYQRSHSVLRIVDRLHIDLANLESDPTGSVAIGIPTSTALFVGVPFIEAVRRAYPGIRVHARTGISGQLEERMHKGELDMALLFQPHREQQDVEWMFEEALYLITRPNLPMTEPYPASKLDELSLLLPSTSRGLRSVLEGVFARQGIAPNVVAEVDGSISTVLKLVSRGVGCSILPWVTIASEARRGELRAIRIVPEIWRRVALCRPTLEAPARAATVVHELLRKVVREEVLKVAATGAVRLLHEPERPEPAKSSRSSAN